MNYYEYGAYLLEIISILTIIILLIWIIKTPSIEQQLLEEKRKREDEKKISLDKNYRSKQ